MGPPTVRRARLALLSIALAGVWTAACSSSASSGDTQDVVGSVRFEDGERLVYRLIDSEGEIVGRGTFETVLIDDVFELRQSYEEAKPDPDARPIVDDVVVVVDALTLKPRSMERTIQRREGDDDESYVATYEEGEEGPVVRVTSVRGDDERERELRLPEHAYESQSSLWLWRTLEIVESYDVRYTSVNPQEPSQTTARVVLVDRVVVTVPAGTFETWRLQIRSGRDTRVAWVHVEPPHEVVRWDNGQLFLELESIGES